MFDKFQDYMYYLLYGPLKRVTKLKNQFYLLFKVMGKVFDQTKQDIFRVREESMIISASERLLDEHGRDRGMQKLKGESVESFRTRLSMKNIIAEKAGTNEGILIALKSLGYKHVNIAPTYKYMNDSERWAEFHVLIPEDDIDLNKQFDNTKIIVKSVKPASALPNYAFTLPSSKNLNSHNNPVMINTLYLNFKDNKGLLLDGSWMLDGSEFLSGNDQTYLIHETDFISQLSILNSSNISAMIYIEKNFWSLDGNNLIDGTKQLNAEIIEEVL